jgi:hypothetical protein
VINLSDKEERRPGDLKEVKEAEMATQMHSIINASGHQCGHNLRTALVATPASRNEYFVPVRQLASLEVY